MKEEPEYDKPPALPPRSEDFEEPDAPPLPDRSELVDDGEGEYEELSEAPPPPPPTGLSLNLLQVHFSLVFSQL